MWPELYAFNSGMSTEHRSITNGQRGWNVQPPGGFSGEGTSPANTISSRLWRGCAGSDAEISARV